MRHHNSVPLPRRNIEFIALAGVALVAPLCLSRIQNATGVFVGVYSFCADLGFTRRTDGL